MTVVRDARERVAQVIGLSPLERPDAGLVTAITEAGALGVLDLGRDALAAHRALLHLSRGGRSFGVRIPEGCTIQELPAEVTVVIVTAADQVAHWAPRDVIVQVTSLDQARAAVAAGACGVIAKGCEAGGRIGDETTFVLLQRLVVELSVPVWAQGGIGEHTAAACIAGGAAGIVLDTQLALVRESSLSGEIKAAIGAMDGSETTVIAGHRVFTRPDLPVAKQAGPHTERTSGRWGAGPDTERTSGRWGAGLDADAVRARLGGDDLATSLLPLGQDAAFAKGLAHRFVTAGQLVRGLRASIASHLALAAEHRPLAPGSPFAAAHGLVYPIAQGPMSRVSDRARFAEAVAAGGGLPFLALTLMTGPEVRELLEETRSLVGDRPWGVGILGFVPPEVREQQLAVLRDIAPPIALIAGGRPSQATPLEAQGTATYLHVPSPGLLELFLRDGARKFVFEGSECGGHVGPRTSFALWEQQLARLLAHPDPSELSVLFAGGIHDARSAAMVAAMAAPLAARGARVGVLMGTAYLFTHEAVAAGAIAPGFQAAAIACERTVLLETSPGHATRCADTAYAEAFAREKHALEDAGVATKDMWLRLEQLNLGRLRIAAKGLKREGDVVSSVDAEAQQRDGMYMIGQVAALRTGTCSVAELHEDVSIGGTALVAAAADRIDEDSTAERDSERARTGSAYGAATDIAVIGLAAIFPGAPDTATFWSNIVAGKSSIREVPADRWSAETYYDPNATGLDAGRKTPSKWGGFLDEVVFDPLSFGIPPKSLAAIEPVQLLSLEIARRALADAGYAERAFDRERTAVIFGAEAGTDLSSAYSFRALFPHYVGPLPAGLDGALPTLSEDSFPGVLSNVIAGRIANRLDLGGSNFTVDAACAASLAALDMAVKELSTGSSDMVLCGGADLHNSINDYLLFSSVHALSPTGQCHTFDANADGIVLGEGVACIVLKRVADAERDGDRIYAVIKAVAGASDGKSLGLTAPRKDGQVRALDRAYKRANVSPAEVGLVEAHGTGTVVGDRTELATLTEVFTRAGAEPATCVLGSVKSQIGHTKCAAGMAGLIKAALSIHHGVLPPTLNIKKPNSAWDRETSPFVFLDQARPWVAEQRVAAVSAFGFGGANFHAVLASHTGTETASAQTAWPSELLLFRGADRQTALALVERVQQLLPAEPHSPASAGSLHPGTHSPASAGSLHPGPALRDLARTVCASGSGAVQIAIVADSTTDLGDKLAIARELKHDPRRGVFVRTEMTEAAGKLAFLCPGQGSQKAGMLADLFIAFPRLHRFLELGAKWAPKMFPPTAFSTEERKAQTTALTDTRVAQPALGVADLAVAELVQSFGVLPDMVAGHSYGELAALCIAGAIGEADLLALSEARGVAILAAAGGDPGTMAAVAADANVVAKIVAACDDVVIANHNSAKQCVLSGSTTGIEKAIALISAAGLTVRRIPVACAFHSPIVAGARETLAQTLAGMAVCSPQLPVFSNTTGAAYPNDPDGVRALLAEQVAKPVQFAEEIEAMYAAGARIFVETGPGQVLTRLTAEILGDRPHVAVACDAGEPGTGIRQLLRSLGALAAAGVAVDTEPLFWDRDATIIELTKEAAKPNGSLWLVNGHSARPAAGAPVQRPPVKPVVEIIVPAAQPAAGATPVAERDGVVIEYLRTMRSMITAQRDVMLSYLGSTTVAHHPAPMVDTASPRANDRVIDVIEATRPHAGAPAPVQQALVVQAVIDPMQLVISIVSERTGYPVETLGVDLDLEADLSIDSIKRIEIIGELAQRLGLRVENGAKDADAMVEELATRKTLRSLVAWLSERIGKISATPELARSSDVEDLMIASGEALAIPVSRYRLEIVATPAPVNGHSTFAGKRFAIYGGGAVAHGLAARLEAEHASVRHLPASQPLDPLDGAVDGYVDLAPIDGVTAMRELFERVRAAAIAGASWIFVATQHGELGRGGGVALGGPAGLIKTVAAEWPNILARVVDLEPGDDVAAVLHAELHSADSHVEIGYVKGVRSSLHVVPAELMLTGDASLDERSVVLVTGGARGITAKVAIALARRYGCRIELVGRSPMPTDEDPLFVAAADVRSLRGLLAKRGTGGLMTTPAEIEHLCARVLAAREIRATLAALGDRGTYHAVDVRTPRFGALIDELYARHGRIDGVIHGAGVLEDKLMRHKTPESFERVFATKIVGARTLVDKLRDDVKHVVMFSSISGTFGNRGQADYAAAGDALDKLAWALQRKISGRVISIDWGPWAGAGMVSPDLEREYARRGIGLIDPQRGIEALFAELGAARGDAQVILTAADPRALLQRAEPTSALVGRDVVSDLPVEVVSDLPIDA